MVFTKYADFLLYYCCRLLIQNRQKLKVETSISYVLGYRAIMGGLINFKTQHKDNKHE